MCVRGGEEVWGRSVGEGEGDDRIGVRSRDSSTKLIKREGGDTWLARTNETGHVVTPSVHPLDRDRSRFAGKKSLLSNREYSMIKLIKLSTSS